jgi:hypothetical protein
VYGAEERENSDPNSVPQGRLNLAQDVSPGLDLKGWRVPQGRLKTGRNAILDNFQPSLRDLIIMIYPGLASCAKSSRPSGTDLRFSGLFAKVAPETAQVVIVHDSSGLHPGVDDDWAYKLEASLFELGRDLF